MRFLWAALLVVGCAAQRFEQARMTGAAALRCPAHELWVVVDDEGWATLGCGQLAGGSETDVATSFGPLTCESQARFDFRLCRAMAKQGPAYTVMGGIAAYSREASAVTDCRNAYDAQRALCVAPQPAPVPAPEPAAPGPL